MRLMTAGAAAVAASALAGAVTAAPAPKTLTFNMSTVTDAQGMHVNVGAKIWVKGQKARAEINDHRIGQLLMLADGPQVRTLLPKRKQGTIRTNGPRNPLDIMIAGVAQLTHGAKKLRAQSFDGYACDIYELTQSSPRGTISVKS